MGVAVAVAVQSRYRNMNSSLVESVCSSFEVQSNCEVFWVYREWLLFAKNRERNVKCVCTYLVLT